MAESLEMKRLQRVVDYLLPGPMETPDVCSGCERLVDLSVCGCGSSLQSHGSPMTEGHAFVPLGCDCLRKGK